MFSWKYLANNMITVPGSAFLSCSNEVAEEGYGTEIYFPIYMAVLFFILGEGGNGWFYKLFVLLWQHLINGKCLRLLGFHVNCFLVDIQHNLAIVLTSLHRANT